MEAAFFLNFFMWVISIFACIVKCHVGTVMKYVTFAIPSFFLQLLLSYTLLQVQQASSTVSPSASFWMLNLTSLLIGILGSLLASGCFLFVMYRFKPRFDISPDVSRRITSNGMVVYEFKVVNLSTYNAHDVKAFLTLCRPVGTNNGMNVAETPIEFVNGERAYIDAKNAETHKNNATYAIRFQTLTDLGPLLGEPASYLKFQLVAKHALSGFSGVHVKTFYDTTCIKIGQFSFGPDLRVT